VTSRAIDPPPPGLKSTTEHLSSAFTSVQPFSTIDFRISCGLPKQGSSEQRPCFGKIISAFSELFVPLAFAFRSSVILNYLPAVEQWQENDEMAGARKRRRDPERLKDSHNVLLTMEKEYGIKRRSNPEARILIFMIKI